jgi:xylan 1,4-beta-xylosidase
VSALASRDERSVSVLVWNYHDDDLPAPASDVDLSIAGLPSGRKTVTHFRVDRDHGNAYERWKAIGAPQQPTPAQRAELEAASKPAQLEAPRTMTVVDGRLDLRFSLPRQGVSLVKVTW